jgi:hypothetical protein
MTSARGGSWSVEVHALIDATTKHRASLTRELVELLAEMEALDPAQARRLLREFLRDRSYVDSRVAELSDRH